MSEITLRLDCDGEDGFRLAVDCQLPSTGVTAIYGPSGSGENYSTQLHGWPKGRQPRQFDSIWG